MKTEGITYEYDSPEIKLSGMSIMFYLSITIYGFWITKGTIYLLGLDFLSTVETVFLSIFILMLTAKLGFCLRKLELKLQIKASKVTLAPNHIVFHDSFGKESKRFAWKDIHRISVEKYLKDNCCLCLVTENSSYHRLAPSCFDDPQAFMDDFASHLPKGVTIPQAMQEKLSNA